MTDFAPWLHAYEPEEPELKKLRDYAVTKGAAWPYWSNKRADYRAVITGDDALDQAAKTALGEALAGYFKLWQQANGRGAKSSRCLGGINLGKIVLAIFGVVFAVLLYNFLNRTGFLDSLAKIDQARGLITFFFVLTISAVILLVALGIFWVENAEDAQKRFQSAKELLAIIIGVLGTILGFYFGTSAGGHANFALSNVAVSPLAVHAGDSAKLTGQITGGAKPYTYSIVFTDPTGTMSEQQLAGLGAKEQKSAEGAIDQSIKAPEVKDAKLVFFILSASDAKNVSVQTSGALFLEPKKAAPATQGGTAPSTGAAPTTPAKPPAVSPAK